jgi:hypothetical protein
VECLFDSFCAVHAALRLILRLSRAILLSLRRFAISLFWLLGFALSLDLDLLVLRFLVCPLKPSNILLQRKASMTRLPIADNGFNLSSF